MFYIQIITLLLGVIGTILLFKYNANKSSQIYLYNKEELDDIEKQDKKERRLAWFGFGLLIICFLTEFLLLFVGRINVC